MRFSPSQVLLGAVVFAGCTVDITGAPCVTTDNCPPDQTCNEVAENGALVKRCQLGAATGGGSGGGSVAGGGTGGTGGGQTGGGGGSLADAGLDAGADAGTDAGFDAGADAGFDAGADAGFDAGADAGFDAGADAGFDAGADAGFDAGFDAGLDAGPTPCDAGCGSFFPYCECLLAAVRPTVANTGDVITLEGRFKPGQVTVVFPDGLVGNISAASQNRLSVIVPAGIRGGGLLTVTNAGVALPSVPFRRASFTLGLGRFDPQYAQPSYARPMPVLTAPRQGHTATVVGPWVYVIGGGGNIERALMNADGTLQPFTVYAPIGNGRSHHTAHLVGSTLYLIGGGIGPSSPVDTIERATVSADGSLSAFTTVPGVTLKTARQHHASVIIGDGLYVIGGLGPGSQALATVERATLQPNGLSDFSVVAGVTLTIPRRSHSLVTVGETVFAIGGTRDNSTSLASLERATIQSGLLTNFMPVTSTNLVTARMGATALVLGPKVYVVGGQNLSTVESATVSNTGVLGPFAIDNVSSLSGPRAWTTTAIVGNSIYALGGQRSLSDSNTLERATINASGALGAPVLSAPAFPAARGGTPPVVVGNTMYFVGGAESARTSVLQTNINPDGTLTPFVAGPSLVVGRTTTRCAVLGDSLYAIGGANSFTSLASIERARVLPDAGLGPWAVVANMNAPRSTATVAALGGTLNVFGGFDYATGYQESWERGVMLADGGMSFSTWDAGTQRTNHVGMVGRNSVYLIGGVVPGIDRIDFDLAGNFTGHFTPAGISLATNRAAGQLAVVGNSVYALGGLTGAPTPSTSIELAFLQRDGGVEGSLSNFIAVGMPTLPLQEYDNCSIVIGNNMYYFFGTSTYVFPLQ